MVSLCDILKVCLYVFYVFFRIYDDLFVPFQIEVKLFSLLHYLIWSIHYLVWSKGIVNVVLVFKSPLVRLFQLTSLKVDLVLLNAIFVVFILLSKLKTWRIYRWKFGITLNIMIIESTFRLSKRRDSERLVSIQIYINSSLL